MCLFVRRLVFLGGRAKINLLYKPRFGNIQAFRPTTSSVNVQSCTLKQVNPNLDVARPYRDAISGVASAAAAAAATEADGIYAGRSAAAAAPICEELSRRRRSIIAVIKRPRVAPAGRRRPESLLCRVLDARERSSLAPRQILSAAAARRDDDRTATHYQHAPARLQQRPSSLTSFSFPRSCHACAAENEASFYLGIFDYRIRIRIHSESIFGFSYKVHSISESSGLYARLCQAFLV